MKRKTFLTAVSILACAVPSIAGDCDRSGFVAGFLSDNQVIFSGYYFHPDHCSSVTIPNGVLGRDSSRSSSHHGFGAILPNEAGTDYLLVQGDYGAILDDPQDIPGSLNQVVALRLRWLEEENASVLKKDVADTVLGDLKAKHLVVLYRCNDTGTLFWEDSIIAIDNGGSICEITLCASPETYETSCSIRDEIAKTWKFEGKKCEREFQKR
ncbi:MAG: hypothetical protein AB1714_19575 [Acidobacteriota bacterium]